MLAEIQLTGKGRPLKVGLVYFDAHGDMNTPETTMSMMMGGMPVAVSCGLCLNRLRRQIGLEIPLPTKYVTFAGVRDTDPLEQEIIDNSDVEMLSIEDSSARKSEHGGVLYNTCELGAVVEKGECLGVLKDTAGRILEELYASYHSIIIDTRWQPTIYPGDWTYHCEKLP